MYTKIYDVIGYVTDQIGILGLAISLLIIWAVISVLCEKKPVTRTDPPMVDHLNEFLEEHH